VSTAVSPKRALAAAAAVLLLGSGACTDDDDGGAGSGHGPADAMQASVVLSG